MLLLAGALGLPVPEDIPLILAGVLVQMGKAKLVWIALVCYFGILIGDLIIYFVGRRLGPKLFQKAWFKSRLSSSRLRRVKFRLEKRSLLMILLARHLFYFRTITFLICGAVRMQFMKFLIADAIAALVSVPLMLGLGYLLAEHYEAAFEFVKKIKWVTLGLVVAGVGGYWFYARRKTVRTDPD